MTKNDSPKRNYWVWITKPEYYRGLDDLEVDHPGSEPEGDEGLGWWTCHKDTRAGDLVLLYRTSPKSDLAYLFEAGSDARLLEEYPPEGTVFESDYERLFDNALRTSPEIKDLQERKLELKQEIESIDTWLNTGLKGLETPPDHELRQEYDQLWDAHAQLDREEDAFLQEGEQQFRTLEQMEKAIESTFGQRRAEVDHRLHEFESRASEQSQVFRKFYEEANRFDAKKAELNHLEEGLRQEVLRLSGLGIDTEIAVDPDFSGDYVCGWEPRHRLESPLSLGRLKTDPFLAKEWNALRASFKGRVFRTRLDIWDRLVEIARRENPGLIACLESLAASRVSPDIESEQAIEDYLSENLAVLRPSFDLELYVSPTGRSGRQLPCREAGGFIDVLCQDRNTGDFVVIELKANRAGRNVAGQIKTYMGWVRKRLAGPDQAVSGLIIADGYDRKLKYALADMENVKFLDLSHFWPTT